MSKKLWLFFTIFLFACVAVIAQERTISGRITSADDGSPLPGVNVRVQGTTNVGTISDAQGQYTIRVPQGLTALNFHLWE